MTSFKPRPDLELRPVQAPREASPEAKVYVLLPSLEALLAAPGFGRHDPICVPGSARPFSPMSFFAAARRRMRVH
jgi:hypothetical protein